MPITHEQPNGFHSKQLNGSGIAKAKAMPYPSDLLSQFVKQHLELESYKYVFILITLQVCSD